MLGSRAVRLTFLRAIDAMEANALSLFVVEYFDGVAVEDAGNKAGEVGKSRRTG